jgi:hypothetical protein
MKDDYDTMSELCADVAKKLFNYNKLNHNCGSLHLSWLMGNYWALIVKETILPNAIKIYDDLVAKNFNEDNKFYFHNDKAFFIPAKNNIKVFAHFTSNLDYIFIMNKEKFHVRRVYRTWNKKGYLKAKEISGTLSKALMSVETLSEFNDDHYAYSRRPSLNAYRKKNFNVTYGDGRDPGYVLSYNDFYALDNKLNRVEDIKCSIGDMEYVSIIQESLISALEDLE